MDTTDDRCERCANLQLSNGALLCLPPDAAFARPVEFMRHPDSQCGPGALLYDPRGLEDLELEYS